MASLALALGALSCDGGGGGTAEPRDAATEPSSGDDGGLDQPGVDAGGDGDADGGGDGDGDPGQDAGPDAAIPACITGCDDVGAECGVIDDHCGGTIDCDPEGDNCEAPESCNTATNQCEACQPASCESLGAGCGVQVPDGCGGHIESCGLGDCATMGAQYACGDDYSACECVPKSFTEVCTALERACGSFDDGCGHEIDCGEGVRCGDFRTCEADGEARSCGACDSSAATRTLACEGRTCGSVFTADGCEYSCGPACASTCASEGACASGDACKCPSGQACFIDTDRCRECKSAAEACGAQTCGFADNGCGLVACGDHEGGCAAGLECADPTYNLDSSVQTCLPQAQARLLGKYLVRTHIFRDTSLGEPSRAEALSLVTIQRSGNNLRMIDEGCVATSVNQAGAQRTLAPSYFNIPQVVVPLSLSGFSWTRASHPTPTGFIAAQPSYCDGPGDPTNASAPDFDTTPNNLVSMPVVDSGADKSWLAAQNPCECPADAAADELPPQQTDANLTDVSDCRINDIDGDGKPGFTVRANPGGSTLIDTSVVSVAEVSWSGNVSATGFHSGAATEPSTIQRAFVACSGSGLYCSLVDAVSDWSCGTTYNRIYFTRLSGADLALTCQSFYDGQAGVDGADQLKINARFQGIAGTSCTDNAGCAAYPNTVCQNSTCWPKTTPGACDSAADCGTGWTCATGTGGDKACWPATCPMP
jgi:hypothetical protein